MNAEDCRRKAKECLRAAQSTSNIDSSLSWRHLSDVWLTLAEQMEQRPSPEIHRSAAVTRRPVEVAEARRITAEKIGDFLRERLTLPNLTKADEPKTSR